jgi:hypothetical protein
MFEEKIPEPQRPLRPGQTEHANDRGTRIHTECELFVRGTGPLPIEAKHFKPEFAALRNLYEQGRVSLEGEWGMNQQWEPCGWRGDWIAIDKPEGVKLKSLKKFPERPSDGDIVKLGTQHHIWVPAWLRLKLDAIVFVSETEAIDIDFKSGRKFGNELKHAEQLQLYQLVTFLRYPLLEKITTELWYLDQDELTSNTFTRTQGLRFQRSWDARGTRMTTAVDFPPNPNIFSCKYCEYGPTGTGHCLVGVK